MSEKPQIDADCGPPPFIDPKGLKSIAPTNAWQFVDFCSDGIAILQCDSWKIVHRNPALQSWLDAGSQASYRNVRDLVSEADWPRLLRILEANSPAGSERPAIEVTLAGQDVPIQLRVGQAEFGDQPHVVLVCQRIAPAVAEQRSPLREDPLTGLPDRNHLVVQLHHWLERTRNSRFTFAVLFIDFNNFKEVNDQRGHMVGDFVLGELARRLASCMRSEDIIARYGGDEFVVLVESVRSEDDCLPIVSRIQETLRKPVSLVDGDVVISASIGLIIADQNVASVDQLLEAADRAMYRVKRG